MGFGVGVVASGNSLRACGSLQLCKRGVVGGVLSVIERMDRSAAEVDDEGDYFGLPGPEWRRSKTVATVFTRELTPLDGGGLP